MDTSEFTEKMVEVGDLVSLTNDCIKSTMWQSLRNEVFVVTYINNKTKVVTINTNDKQILVFSYWLKKYSMEE